MSDLEYTEDQETSQPSLEAPGLLRDAKGRLMKGTPPGPGRPKGSVSLKEKIIQRLLQEHMDKRLVIEHLADNIVQDGLDGKNGWDKEILHQLDGMPRQNLGIGGENPGDPVQFTMINLADVHPGEVPTETIPTTTPESV